MKRREFVMRALYGALAMTAAVVSGCAFSRVSVSARSKAEGDPWRCSFCGYLQRSRDDLSKSRCPRCMRKKTARISEEEMARYLKLETDEQEAGDKV